MFRKKSRIKTSESTLILFYMSENPVGVVFQNIFKVWPLLIHCTAATLAQTTVLSPRWLRWSSHWLGCFILSCTCYSPYGSWRASINTSVSSCPLLFSKLSKRFSSHSRVKGKVLHNMVHSLHSLSLSDLIPYHSTETLHQRAVFPFSGTFLEKHTPFLVLAMTHSQHVGS